VSAVKTTSISTAATPATASVGAEKGSGRTERASARGDREREREREREGL
jgi:hypothetical protein